ncbi:MAG: hypothetical protein Q4D29_00015 [Lachnospiraceae bacterium]|nr:hypothetical protein [Lachnospiraceae bacterium]
MPTTVNLQGTVSYGLIPIWILFIILISPLLKRIYEKKRRKKEEKKAMATAMPKVKKVPPSVKERYIEQLDGILLDYKEGKRDKRDSYQLLSFFLREFFNEYTGIDVTRKTLAEIRGVANPVLISLIEEFYACEFAPDADGDIEKSITNTIKKIKQWN